MDKPWLMFAAGVAVGYWVLPRILPTLMSATPVVPVIPRPPV